jgi:diguanylate cyclase (GGDEF)-like protein/PAS domain S-box-containing protein
MTTKSLRLGRRIIAPTAALMAVSLGILLGLMAMNAATEDQTARQHSINTVASNLQLRETQVGRVAKDYAWWNDAVRHLHLDLDPEWADLNFAGYIYETHGYHLTLVVDPANATSYAAVEGERVAPGDIPAITGGLETLVEAARQAPAEEPDYQTGLVLVDGQAALVGVSAITPEELGGVAMPAGPRSVLAFIKYLDQVFFNDLAERYQLSGMHIGAMDEGEPALAALDLATVDGTPIGQLVWLPHRPGWQFLQSIAPSLLLALVVIAGFSGYVMRHAGEAARAVEDSEARFRDVADASSDWIWETDSALNFVFVSERVAQLTGRPADAIVGRRLDDLFHQGDNAAQWARYKNALAHTQPFRNVLALCDDADGGRLTLRIAGKPSLDAAGRFVGYRGTATDITRELDAERRAQFLTRHDALTGLPNRCMLGERLDDAIAVVGRRRDMAALMSVDLDRFKDINDTLGHAAGDALIKAVAQRLEACVRETDTLARTGGDEFVVIQTGVQDIAAVELLARRILDVIAEPFEIADERVVITTSIGIALIPLDGSIASRLLQSADIALDRAKAEGRGSFRFFERDMDAKLQDRKALERDLRLAIARHELELFYQPKVDLKSGRVSGVEALVRWHHPERGMVSPVEFIGIAEQTGLIHELGEWVLRTACGTLAHRTDLEIAVNLSAVQLKRGKVAEMVEDVLAETGLDPRRLELEITESVMVDGAEAVIADLRQVKDMGVKIAMDDFGTGYSSLSYLNRFPFDKIKIDRSFVNDLGRRGKGQAIVKAVVGIGRSLGIKICAEGVETADQLRFLERAGCNEVQGYYFAKPMPIGGLEAFMARPLELREPAA